MPFRDAAETLDEAARSVLAQEGVALELVAVDDGSRDDGVARLDAWAKRDPRVVVLASRGVGIVPALERAVEAARGRMIARMDADDVSLPGRLARQVEWLEQDPRLGAVGARVEPLGNCGEGMRAATSPGRTPSSRPRTTHASSSSSRPFAIRRSCSGAKRSRTLARGARSLGQRTTIYGCASTRGGGSWPRFPRSCSSGANERRAPPSAMHDIPSRISPRRAPGISLRSYGARHVRSSYGARVRPGEGWLERWRPMEFAQRSSWTSILARSVASRAESLSWDQKRCARAKRRSLLPWVQEARASSCGRTSSQEGLRRSRLRVRGVKRSRRRDALPCRARGFRRLALVAGRTVMLGGP